MSDASSTAADRTIPTLPDKALALLGFCRRNGKIVCGAGQVLAAVTGKRPPYVVVIASDASARTQKQLIDKCSYRGIKLVRASSDGEKLAHFLGKCGVVMAAGATDPAIARQIIRLTDEDAANRE